MPTRGTTKRPSSTSSRKKCAMTRAADTRSSIRRPTMPISSLIAATWAPQRPSSAAPREFCFIWMSPNPDHFSPDETCSDSFDYWALRNMLALLAAQPQLTGEKKKISAGLQDDHLPQMPLCPERLVQCAKNFQPFRCQELELVSPRSLQVAAPILDVVAKANQPGSHEGSIP